jgi:hypothetical protein
MNFYRNISVNELKAKVVEVLNTPQVEGYRVPQDPHASERGHVSMQDLECGVRSGHKKVRETDPTSRDPEGQISASGRRQMSSYLSNTASHANLQRPFDGHMCEAYSPLLEWMARVPFPPASRKMMQAPHNHSSTGSRHCPVPNHPS